MLSWRASAREWPGSRVRQSSGRCDTQVAAYLRPLLPSPAPPRAQKLRQLRLRPRLCQLQGKTRQQRGERPARRGRGRRASFAAAAAMPALTYFVTSSRALPPQRRPTPRAGCRAGDDPALGAWLRPPFPPLPAARAPPPPWMSGYCAALRCLDLRSSPYGAPPSNRGRNCRS